MNLSLFQNYHQKRTTKYFFRVFGLLGKLGNEYVSFISLFRNSNYGHRTHSYISKFHVITYLSNIFPPYFYYFDMSYRKVGYGGDGRGGGKGDSLVKLSKSLSHVLRHQAKRVGLNIQTDGYVRLDELVGDLMVFVPKIVCSAIVCF